MALLSFFRSLSSTANTPDHIKCISFNNQYCMTQPTLINWHSNECIKGLRYYLFAFNLDRCMESCNILNYLSNEVFVPKKTKDLIWSVFNMIVGINESNILTKHISCECKCKFDSRKYNSNQKWNNDKYRCAS